MKLSEYLAKYQITQKAFAAQLGLSQGMVWQWITGRSAVDAAHCPTIERLTDGEVRCEDLNNTVEWAVLREPCKQGK